MLAALEAAAVEKAKATAWTMTNAQLAQLLEAVHSVHRVLHTAYMKAPHPEPYEAWRPDHIKAAAKAEADKPLSGRKFLMALMGRR